MPVLTLPDFETLDPDAVAQAHSYITQRINEFAPTVETMRGVIHDIVVYLEGVLSAGTEETADRIRKSGSLLAIEADPTLADDTIVDGVLSNFRVERKAGSQARGSVVIVLSQFLPSNLPSGTRFAAEGQEFVTETPFAGRVAQSAVVTTQDRLIRAVGDGTYAYTIDVVAVSDGSAAMLRRNTKLTPLTLIPNVVTTYAESDFTGGLSGETNSELVERLRQGISARDLSNRDTIAALIRNTPEFERVLATAVVAYGDPEQTRYHGIFPVATGGRMDIYVKTQGLPQTLRLEKTAVLVDQVADGGVWQVPVTRDEAPGFYDVVRIVRAETDETSAGYEVTEDDRALDLSPVGIDDFLPDLVTPTEGAYSRYQATIIRFLDTDTDPQLPVGTQADYVIFPRAMPQIAAIQDLLAARGVRPASGDVLVRAPVPCDVRLSFRIVKRAGQANPDIVSMATAIADEVNRTGFIGRLAASTIVAIAHQFLTDGQSTGAIDLFGTIRRPDGTKRYIRNDVALQIPDEAARSVSGRTTAFFLDPSDIAIDITTADVPPV